MKSARDSSATRDNQDDAKTNNPNRETLRRNQSSKRNPSPETTPFRQKLPYASAPLHVEVLADGASSDPTITGHTGFKFPSCRFPNYQYDRTTRRITAFTGDFEFPGPITIQTVYGPGASKNQLSLYGRGTTEQDKEDGNITLGFHESCHRLDYMEYLATNPLPEFPRTVGTTVQQYRAAQQDFAQKYNAYIVAIGNYSEQRTDEVGYKRSTHLAEGTDME